MKVVFSGLEDAFELVPSVPFVLEIQNPTLFSRMCQSFAGNEGEFSVEPYTLWEGEEQLKTRDVFLPVYDVFTLPWDARVLGSLLHKRIETMLFDDEDVRLVLEGLNEQIMQRLFEISIFLHSDYAFASEWDVKKYMKAFSYGVEYNVDDTLFDSLIKFLGYARDMQFKGTLVFLNLSNFLTNKEYQSVLDKVFFEDLSVILLENNFAYTFDGNFIHYRIDQEFVGEYII